MMDPLLVLGLSPGASPREIKHAFRRLAMSWHPDRNPAPHAAEEFKRCRAAYEKLMAFAREPEAEAEAAEAAPASAAADEPRGEDLRQRLSLSLEEAAFGCGKTLIFESSVPCEDCDGSGESGPARSRLCADCHGTGRIRGQARHLERCDCCGGRGYRSERTCAACDGEGRHASTRSLHVTVPPGMLAGDELRLAGQGGTAPDGGVPGDLFLSVAIDAHDLFRLEGRDLVCDVPVSVLLLLAGGMIEVPTLDGAIGVELEPGAPGARQQRVAGRGFPGRKNSAPGDLVLNLSPVYPQQLSAKQASLLRQLEQSLAADLPRHAPDIEGWKRRCREFLARRSDGDN